MCVCRYLRIYVSPVRMYVVRDIRWYVVAYVVLYLFRCSLFLYVRMSFVISV